MTNRFMMSVAAAALIASAGFANAQGTGTKEQPSGSSAQQQNAPSSERGSSSGMKATQSEEKSPGAAKNQRAEDKAQGQKSKSSENEGAKAGKDMKAEGKSGKDMKAEGQAGAAAKLSTEQRTQITTVIRDAHVAPVTNVNFSISVGTRVPRDVSFHVLPERVVAIYPEWRGFKFIIVREQILIIDPNTFEIVAILEV